LVRSGGSVGWRGGKGGLAVAIAVAHVERRGGEGRKRRRERGKRREKKRKKKMRIAPPGLAGSAAHFSKVG
jgi:hypothetical protein